MRLNTDLVGCASNLQRIAIRHRNDVEAIEEVWSDARAKHFLSIELPEVEEAVKRLVVYLQKTIDLTETINHQTRDNLPED